MCVRQELSHGSTIGSDSAPIAIKDHRKTVKNDEHEILQEDIFFPSPSYVAMFFIDRSANGLKNCKTSDGGNLESFESGNADTIETYESSDISKRSRNNKMGKATHLGLVK